MLWVTGSEEIMSPSQLAWFFLGNSLSSPEENTFRPIPMKFKEVYDVAERGKQNALKSIATSTSCPCSQIFSVG
jgi:hypothetical protein